MDGRREDYLLYLGLCHAWGWPPSDRGLEEFLRQLNAGWRDKNGRMIWP